MDTRPSFSGRSRMSLMTLSGMLMLFSFILCGTMREAFSDAPSTITLETVGTTPHRRLQCTIDRGLVEQLVSFVKQKGSLAVVTFTTDFVERDIDLAQITHPMLSRVGYKTAKRKDRVVVPATGLSNVNVIDGRSLKTLLHVQGNFENKKLLLGLSVFPRHVHVSETRKVDMQWGGDKVYSALCALIPDANPYSKSPLWLLAATPRGTIDVLNSHFFAIEPEDLSRLTSVSPLLRREASERLSLEEAEKLLSSSNPWKIWLGLYSLSRREALADRHFGLAFKALSLDSDKDLIDVFLDKPYVANIHKILEQVLAQRPNSIRMQHVIKIAEEELKGRAPITFGRRADLLAFQVFLMKFRHHVGSGPTAREVIHNLDALDIVASSYMDKLSE